MTETRGKENQGGKLKIANEAFKHPLVLLLTGSILGSLLIPYLRDRDARARELESLRLQKALAAFSANEAVDSNLNNLLTGFELLLKSRTRSLDSTRDHELQRQIYGHYSAFNQNAWWWFARQVNEARILGLLDPESFKQAEALSKCYDQNLRTTTQNLESFWLLMEGAPAAPHREDVGQMMNRARQANRENRTERFRLVGAFAALILHDPEGKSTNSSHGCTSEPGQENR